MSEKKIKSEYQKKIKSLQKHNLLYYDKSNPKISDKDYDNLKEEILKLEKHYNFLNDSNSPSKTVGFKPSRNFKKSAHREKMLSLSNAFDEEDLVNFEKKICNYLNLDKNKSFEYSVEPKIDGISASLTYKMEIYYLVCLEVMEK